MIFGFREEHEIGSVITLQLCDAHKTLLPLQPCVVMREATEEEWSQECALESGKMPDLEMGYELGYRHFYELHTD
jgi:hypothetical protein